MSDRPDYMPRWFNWRSVPPEILIGWFIVMTPFATALLVWAAINGSVLAILSGVAAVVLLGSQAAIYVPRAWRASKAGQSGGWQRWRGRWPN